MVNRLSLLASDRMARVEFLGDRSAELFSRECRESLEGVLNFNYYGACEGENCGFVSASIDGRPFTNIMWPRDVGVFLREMVCWGLFEHAAQTAEYLISHVSQNERGFRTYPEQMLPGAVVSGAELDGSMAIVLGLVLLWQRLGIGHPTRSLIENFLRASDSPVASIHDELSRRSLLQGSGEFGLGCGIEGLGLNVVQNYMAFYALQAVAGMELESGNGSEAERHLQLAGELEERIGRNFVDGQGKWIWCLGADSMKPDASILSHPINKGFGGLNGVLAMSCDCCGLLPDPEWPGLNTSIRTYEDLLRREPRRTQFEKYGMWTQFDEYIAGLSTGPSYGHGYATQCMLLLDRMDEAQKALDYLALATVAPPRRTPISRPNPYWFYERYQSPDGHDDPSKPGYTGWDEGCGALNLVCVAEALKIARLIIGIDDSVPDSPILRPRIPPRWSGYAASDWPMRTSQGTVSLDILVSRVGDRLEVACEIQGIRSVTGEIRPGEALELDL